MGDLDTVLLNFLARPLGADREERDSVLVVGKNIMQLEADPPPESSKSYLL